MARTLLTPVAASGPYPTIGTALPFQAADGVNFNTFPSTGKELVIALNSDAAPHTVTIHSQADQNGRTGDITAETIAPGAYHIFGPFAKSYWADSTGKINVDASDATVKFAVITLP